jgi:hypothetical protein
MVFPEAKKKKTRIVDYARFFIFFGGTEQAKLRTIGTVRGGPSVVGAVSSKPVGGELERGGWEIGPLMVEEALEIGHRGPSAVVLFDVRERELVGEAGGSVGVGEDPPRLAEEREGAGDVFGVEGGVEGAEH